MRRSDFHYDLPGELIAQAPLPDRTASRLLVLDGATGRLRDDRFSALRDYMHEGDLLVLNDTRVIPARLRGHKASGGRVEVLIERITGETRALAQVRASKSPGSGSVLHLAGADAVVTGRCGAFFELEFDRPVEALLDRAGEIPLPPYIERPPQAEDAERYQTIYAADPGAVAAPTAGLHFDDGMLARLEQQGVGKAFITLHVGAGTFAPVRTDVVEEHRLHTERVVVTDSVCEQILATRAAGGRIVAVGTTTVRALESAARDHGIAPFDAETDLFISPGFRFRVVDVMITNFHLPESSLIMLVAAFAGTDAVLNAYRHAVAERYRFFSYGDAMLITRAGETT
ncbi:MAG TPA: tRNA preQ1(34) S-adenosylmethionine ribosyltransferase-isomerase QueA [Gammaproteobacteria bacterium]